jgi:hypothetical protein
MGMYFEIESIDSTTVRVFNGDSSQTYKKAELFVSRTHFSTYLKNKNHSQDAIVASWNLEQANLYNFSSLEDIEGYLLSLINGIGLTAISSYTSGYAFMDFISDGLNGWDIGIGVNPFLLQVPSLVTVSSVDYDIKFLQAGVLAFQDTGNTTVSTGRNTGANGAGCYLVYLKYNMSDGSFFENKALYVVNATSSVLHYFIYRGTEVNSVTGLYIDVTANYSQSGSLSINWSSFNGSTYAAIGTGDNAALVARYDTTAISASILLDSAYSDFGSSELIITTSVKTN